jgi:hypothetical protein
MSGQRARYLRRAMQRRACRHSWFDMTEFGDRERRLYCFGCKRTQWETR